MTWTSSWKQSINRPALARTSSLNYFTLDQGLKKNCRNIRQIILARRLFLKAAQCLFNSRSMFKRSILVLTFAGPAYCHYLDNYIKDSLRVPWLQSSEAFETPTYRSVEGGNVTLLEHSVTTIVVAIANRPILMVLLICKLASCIMSMWHCNYSADCAKVFRLIKFKSH